MSRKKDFEYKLRKEGSQKRFLCFYWQLLGPNLYQVKLYNFVLFGSRHAQCSVMVAVFFSKLCEQHIPISPFHRPWVYFKIGSHQK